MLHEDGVGLNGVVLQSSILDYSQPNGSVGILPTFAADALYHTKVKVSPLPKDLPSFMKDVEKFARKAYASAKATFPDADATTIRLLSDIVGISPAVLKEWNLDVAIQRGTTFLTTLLQDEGDALGAYDGRAKQTIPE